MFIYKFQAFAITEEGELFCWGENDRGMIGMEKMNEKYYKVSRLNYFKDYEAMFVGCGNSHSILLARDKSDG